MDYFKKKLRMEHGTIFLPRKMFHFQSYFQPMKSIMVLSQKCFILGSKISIKLNSY